MVIVDIELGTKLDPSGSTYTYKFAVTFDVREFTLNYQLQALFHSVCFARFSQKMLKTLNFFEKNAN